MTAQVGRRLAAAILALALPAAGDDLRTPPAERRGVEQSYLTFPEWFLVFSPAEFAAYTAHHPPSGFPFLGHVAQFWQGSRAVLAATEQYPGNSEYQTMIAVIGTSATVEYGLKAAYEILVGRLFELTAPYPATEEDRLAATVAAEYVEFIHRKAFYDFDFTGALARVWQTSLWGPHPLRKWERKYALTTEYASKAVYGWLIGLGTRASYDVPRPVTVAIVEGLPKDTPGVAERFPDGSVRLDLPRYAAFTDRAADLARAGARFREIAGNRDAILVSALVPREWSGPPPGSSMLFAQDILTEPGIRRVVLVVPVASLHVVLAEVGTHPLRLEHVFDY